jgi:hypothetical protein
MSFVRPFAAVTALLLLGGLNLAPGADKVLVPGDPPLTQETVDLYHQMWEWYFDLRLSRNERRQLEELFITFWKKSDRATSKSLLASYSTMEKKWRGILDLKGPDQERHRSEVRERWLAGFRKSQDPYDRLLLSIYDAAYKPGGTKNPILVEGDPPLTQAMIDTDAAAVELLLDLRLTDEQRRKFRDLWIADWKSWDPGKRQRNAKNIESWANLPTYSNYKRNLQRSLDQPRLLEVFRKKDSGERARWLLALHESAIKPGSARNPVLVDGEPALTQLVADRYGDYIEVMLDLSISGGLTAPQRQVLQDYLVKDWKKMGADGRKELLADLKRWADAVAAGNAEANKSIRALRPKLLAQLRTARDDPRSVWLLEVFDTERGLVKQREEMQRIVDEVRQYIGSPGHWEYNGNTRRHEWVPDR